MTDGCPELFHGRDITSACEIVAKSVVRRVVLRRESQGRFGPKQFCAVRAAADFKLAGEAGGQNGAKAVAAAAEAGLAQIRAIEIRDHLGDAGAIDQNVQADRGFRIFRILGPAGATNWAGLIDIAAQRAVGFWRGQNPGAGVQALPDRGRGIRPRSGTGRGIFRQKKFR